MPSATSWRIYITANNGSAVPGIAEVAMHSSIGGANLCTGGTASASSYYTGQGGYPASNAVDGNTSTFWDAATGVPQWWQYDFPTAQSIVEFSITAPQGGNVNDTPKDFALQYYDTASSSWIALLSRTGEAGWTAGQTRTYSSSNLAAVAKQQWRLNITSVTSGVPGIGELVMRTVAGGANACTGGTPSASSYYLSSSTYAPDKAFDGNASTFWDANTGTLPGWLQYDFGKAVSIVEYAITAPPNGNQNNAPTGWNLQYNDGNGNWINADTRTSQPSWGANETRTFSLGSAIVARPQVCVCT